MAAIKGSKRRNKMVMDCVEMDSRCVACHSESLRELMRSFVVILSTFFTRPVPLELPKVSFASYVPFSLASEYSLTTNPTEWRTRRRISLHGSTHFQPHSRGHHLLRLRLWLFVLFSSLPPASQLLTISCRGRRPLVHPLLPSLRRRRLSYLRGQAHPS